MSDQGQSEVILNDTMEQSSSISATWRSSTSMIFWGVLALTIFGWVTSILEPVYTVINIFFKFAMEAYNGNIVEYGEGPFAKLATFYNGISTAMRVFEALTIASWVIYVIGLSQLRSAQVTQRGLRLAGSLNTACWLGLSAIFCGFLAGFLGMFGLLFRFTGWVLMLISMFKFRSTFGKLSWEKSWNKKAQNGASRLKTSYTLAIILEFFPMICGLIIFFVAFGAIGSSMSIIQDFANDGMGAVGQYLAGAVGFIVVMILAGLILWISKIVCLFSGWSKVMNGGIRREILAGKTQKVSAAVMEEEDEEEDGDDEKEMTVLPTVSEALEEDNSDDALDEDSDTRRNWIIGGVIGGAAIMILILWLCLGGKSSKTVDDNTAEPLTEIEFSEESEEQEAPITSDNEEDDVESDQTDDTETAAAEEPAGDEYTHSYQGTINGVNAIEMTLTTDGGAYYSGEYFYTKNKQPIQLRGQLTDDNEHLVLEEYAGMNMTGKFEGTLTCNGYSGTWTSADGEKSYPFSITKK